MPFAEGAVYAMSKSALQGLVQGAARDLGPRGITINNVQPGPVNTDLNPDKALRRDDKEDERDSSLRDGRGNCRDGRLLANPEAAYVTGANLMIEEVSCVVPSAAMGASMKERDMPHMPQQDP